jgi:uncharacterized protein
MIEMKLQGVILDPVREMSFVLLKEANGSRTLQIYISREQAEDISNVLADRILPRPRTHDLIVSILDGHEIEIDRILITSLRDNTFFASIFTKQNGQIREFDARPSDAIAIAIRTKTPIEATEEVLVIASI